VLRTLSVDWRVRFAPGSFLQLIADPVGSVLDNLFAGVLLAVLAYALRDVIRDWLKDMRTVKTLHFNSLEECLKLLSAAIAAYEKDITEAHITISTPLLFSREYIRYYYESRESRASSDILERTKRQATQYLGQFQTVLEIVVETCDGAYDKTLLSETGIPTID
jgi:hypothetical protein